MEIKETPRTETTCQDRMRIWEETEKSDVMETSDLGTAWTWLSPSKFLFINQDRNGSAATATNLRSMDDVQCTGREGELRSAHKTKRICLLQKEIRSIGVPVWPSSPFCFKMDWEMTRWRGRKNAQTVLSVGDGPGMERAPAQSLSRRLSPDDAGLSAARLWAILEMAWVRAECMKLRRGAAPTTPPEVGVHWFVYPNTPTEVLASLIVCTSAFCSTTEDFRWWTLDHPL